jgi:hypothetical protein
MMKIHITKFDLDRLHRLLDMRKPHDEYDRALTAELANAEVVAAKDYTRRRHNDELASKVQGR